MPTTKTRLHRPRITTVLTMLGGVLAGGCIQGLLDARIAGNEASALGSLHAISSAQSTYASVCAGGGYAVTLEDLAKPATGQAEGFIRDRKSVV